MVLKISAVTLIAAAIVLQGCGVYSFSGASISPDIKTISIDNFYNDTPDGPANLSQLFTEEMRDYFAQNTSLTLVQEEGDLQFEGRIVRYETTPEAPTASREDDGLDLSALTRLTISVQTSYFNTQDDTFNFDQSFSFFSTYDNQRFSLTDVEGQLIDEITEQIVVDIFNASVANW